MMRAGSPPTDPTLAALGDLIGMLRAVASGGIDQVIAQLETARSKAVSDVQAACAVAENKFAELDEKEKADDARAVEQKQKDTELAQREHDIHAIKLHIEARLEELKALDGKIIAEKSDVSEQKKALEAKALELNQEHEQRAHQLDADHARRVEEHNKQIAQLDYEYQTKLEVVRLRDNNATALETNLNKRSSDLDLRETAVTRREAEAEKLAADYKARAKKLREYIAE